MSLDREYIKRLIPVNQLQNAHRMQMFEHSQMIELRAGDELSATEEQRFFLYLVSGKVSLLDIDRESILLRYSDERACHPLFGEGENKTQLIAQTHSLLVRYNRVLFNTLLDQELGVEEQDAEVRDGCEMSGVEGGLFNEIMRAFNTGELKLPSLPDIASKVKRAVARQGCTAEDISCIVAVDPSMVTRLIGVANGPLNRGVTTVGSIQSAVLRLGLRTSKELVMGFAVKELFKSPSEMFNLRMRKLYDQSIEVAAISFTLAKLSGSVDPDQALLAGLLHQVGGIPILSYIQQTGLVVVDDTELDNILKHLGGAVGELVIQYWGLPDELSVVVKECDNWTRHSGAVIDSCDMVIAAQIYSRLKHQQLDGLPSISSVPAFKKIFSTMAHDAQNERFAEDVFKQADEGVAIMMQLLRM